jgi:O-antigen/teichoic acid export membrane protein
MKKYIIISLVTSVLHGIYVNYSEYANLGRKEAGEFEMFILWFLFPLILGLIITGLIIMLMFSKKGREDRRNLASVFMRVVVVVSIITAIVQTQGAYKYKKELKESEFYFLRKDFLKW